MRLIYIYDALCGWCYGFSPVIQEFAKAHQDELQVEVLSGGMVTGERVGPIGQVAGYIRQAYQTVEERTGVQFGKGFLKNILEPGTAVFDSVPPSLALTIAKNFKPELALSFAGALQKAIYEDGIIPQDTEAYVELAGSFGLDTEQFRNLMGHEDAISLTQQEFNLVKNWGIHGFPTLLLHEGENLALIAQGYISLEDLEKQYQLARKQIMA